MENEIKAVIDELRPFLMNDGGNVEFIKYEDNIVYIVLQGACMGCPMKNLTLKDGIEKTIVSKIPEVKEVRLWEE